MQNVEAMLLAATAATAAQQAAWQAAIIGIIVLAFNIAMLIVAVWIVHKIDLIERTIQGMVLVVKKKDTKTSDTVAEP